MWVLNSKIDIYVFPLSDIESFILSWYIFSSWSCHKYLIVGILKVPVPPLGGILRCQDKQSLLFWIEIRAFSRWVSPGGLRIPMGWHIGYRVCGYSTFQIFLIDVHFSWIFKITGPTHGTSSSSCPIMGIHWRRWYEPCPYFQRGGGLLLLVHIYAVNLRRRSPAALFNLYWNSLNHYIIYWHLFLNLNTNRPPYQ